MTRRERQLEELRALCTTGRVARALDLACEHVASFGPDDRVLALLAGAVEGEPATSRLRMRVAELEASSRASPSASSGPPGR
jgi:hypothetical protein